MRRTVYTDADLTGGMAIVLGSEADGLSTIWRDAASTAVHIPMLRHRGQPQRQRQRRDPVLRGAPPAHHHRGVVRGRIVAADRQQPDRLHSVSSRANGLSNPVRPGRPTPAPRARCRRGPGTMPPDPARWSRCRRLSWASRTPGTRPPGGAARRPRRRCRAP